MQKSMEKMGLLGKTVGKSYTPRPYRYRFAVKDSPKLTDVREQLNFWFVNFGLLSCYVECGLIIAALGSIDIDILAILLTNFFRCLYPRHCSKPRI